MRKICVLSVQLLYIMILDKSFYNLHILIKLKGIDYKKVYISFNNARNYILFIASSNS